jgi:hypothetical protein
MTRQDAIDQALFYSLHSFSQAQTRWQQRRDRGLDDNELQLAVAEEFGIEGGAALYGLWYSYKGGKNPKFTLERWPGMPDDFTPLIIHGTKLVLAVRQLLSIPDHSQQLSLF